MKTIRKITAMLCVLLLVGGLFAVCANAQNTDVDYVIGNPYGEVNWDTVSQFKADLHSHTTASDGNNTLKEMTEAHYDKGFDIVAVTDHGIVDYGWTQANTIPAMKVVVVAFKDRPAFIQVLEENGEAGNGNAYALVNENGDEYYYQVGADGEKGKCMMRVPYGIENNPSSINNAHVNSWFADYGNGRMGGTSDYVTPIAGVDKLGGLSVINHPGEYTNARDEVYTADAYNEKNISYKYIIQKFAGILMKYDTCIGIDCNSKGDSRTRFDRKLWDILLQRVVPTGRNVFAIASSDAHSSDVVYTGYTMICEEENTSANLKDALSKGAFFAASKSLGNYDEIAEIAALLNEGETEQQRAMGVTMTALAEKIAGELADGDQSAKYNADPAVDAPVVKAVAVDEAEDTITLTTTDDALLVRWIADGKCIATGKTIDLDDYSDKIGSYVRAEIFGEGGIVYTQPFTLEYDGAPEAGSTGYFDVWWLASVIPDNLVRLLALLPIFKWIWAGISK